jgi:hypothetical protein
LTWSPEGGGGGRRRRPEMKWEREVKRVKKQKTATPIAAVNWQIW